MSCENCEESAYVIERMGKLLAEIAIAVNGPEPPLTRWSYHDLPAKVRALKEAQQPAAAVPDGYALEAVAELAAALDAVDGVMQDAYNRGHQVCCGQGYSECCGNPIVEWEPADNAIMSGLQPVHATLAAMLAALDAARGQAVDDWLAESRKAREEMRSRLDAVGAPPAALDAAALAKRLDKMLGTHADSMPKEAYAEVDAVMRALKQAPPAAVVPAGWVIERRADGLAVIAPNCDPGGIALAGPSGSLPRRLLYRLAEAMLAAAERKGEQP